MPGIPFDIESDELGLSKSKGVMHVDDEHLTFEIQTTYVGFFKRPPKTYQIDLTDLDEVGYEKGFLRDQLTVRTRPLGRIAQLPGADERGLTLCVKRAHRKVLQTALDRLHLWLSSET